MRRSSISHPKKDFEGIRTRADDNGGAPLFPRGSSLWELLRPLPQQTIFEKNKKLRYRMESPTWPRGTQREDHAKQNVVISGGFGLRSPVVQKIFQTKTATCTSIMARVFVPATRPSFYALESFDDDSPPCNISLTKSPVGCESGSRPCHLKLGDPCHPDGHRPIVFCKQQNI